MAKYNFPEAATRLDKVVKDYNEKYPENPVGILITSGMQCMINSKYFSYVLFRKIYHVINLSSNEYWIKPTDSGEVVVKINFFR